MMLLEARRPRSEYVLGSSTFHSSQSFNIRISRRQQTKFRNQSEFRRSKRLANRRCRCHLFSFAGSYLLVYFISQRFDNSRNQLAAISLSDLSSKTGYMIGFTMHEHRKWRTACIRKEISILQTSFWQRNRLR